MSNSTSRTSLLSYHHHVPSPETDLKARLREAKSSPLSWKRKLLKLEASQLCRKPPRGSRVAEDMARHQCPCFTCGLCLCSRNPLRTQYWPIRCVACQAHCVTCLKEFHDKKRYLRLALKTKLPLLSNDKGAFDIKNERTLRTACRTGVGNNVRCER